MSFDLLKKIVIMGDGGVGKSKKKINKKKGSLIMRYKGEEYSDIYDPTIEYEYKVKIEKEEVIIMDTSGNDEYLEDLSKDWLKDCIGIILVFDLTSEVSFNQLEKIKKIINKNIENIENISFVLVGNKNDKEKIIKKTKIEQFCKIFWKKLEYFESSSKSNENVYNSFYKKKKKVNKKK
jgi:small GTP-binding protein